MEYSVQKLAKIAMVSVRTLHYYDEIGLLRPKLVKSNGYRFYGQKELLILQQILFFRELDFTLDQIKSMLNAPNFDMETALRDQRKLLELKKSRIENLIFTVEKTIQGLKGGESVDTNNLYAGFSNNQVDKYKEEAREKWGGTKAYEQSQERTKNWTKADYLHYAQKTRDLLARLSEVMGKDVGSKEVQDLIVLHRQGIETFYDCSDDMYHALGQMYTDDKRFTDFYNQFRPGLAKFIRDAIFYSCDQKK